jgi:hypothetical protein
MDLERKVLHSRVSASVWASMIAVGLSRFVSTFLFGVKSI